MTENTERATSIGEGGGLPGADADPRTAELTNDEPADTVSAEQLAAPAADDDAATHDAATDDAAVDDDTAAGGVTAAAGGDIAASGGMTAAAEADLDDSLRGSRVER